MVFSEKEIPFLKVLIACEKYAFKGIPEDSRSNLSESQKKKWFKTAPGQFPKAKSGNTFGFLSKESPNKPCSTITSHIRNSHWKHQRFLNKTEITLCSSFPLDYEYKVEKLAVYIMGMSVPPLMMHKISREIHKQWFS